MLSRVACACTVAFMLQACESERVSDPRVPDAFVAAGADAGGSRETGEGAAADAPMAAEAAGDAPVVADGPAGGEGPVPADAPAAGDARSDLGGPDGGCEHVCWRPVPRLTNPEEGESQEFVGDGLDCRCPDGFACTGSLTVKAGVATRNGLGGYHDPPLAGDGVTTERVTATYPVCEPVAGEKQPRALVFDFPAGAPLVPVTLRFRRGGAAWPQSAVPESAGEITITPEKPGAPLVLPLPTDAEAALKVALPPGRHSVRLQMGRGLAFDPLKYPVSTLAGELTVESEGETTIDIPATAFTYDLRLGSVPFPAPGPGESVALRIEGRYGLPGVSSNLIVIKRAAGQRLDRGTIWLEPGKYTVTVITEGVQEAPSLPSGFVIATRFLEIGTTPEERTFDLRLVELDGAITVDGKDLPAGAQAEIGLNAKDAVARAVVASTRPARYRALAFGGEYDVLLTTEADSEAAGVPSGAVRVFAQKLLDRNLTADLATTTVRLSAEVVANGALLADAVFNRGTLALDGGVIHQFMLGAAGPATISALVFKGDPSVVSVLGAVGGPLPNTAVSVDPAFIASATPAKFDLAIAPVTLGLRIDGRDPPDASVLRGSFRLSRADDPAAGFRAFASSAGPLTAKAALTPGVWKVAFETQTGAVGMPAGEIALPDLVVPREGLSRTFEVTSVDVVIEIRRDGAPLADATGEMDRGTLQVGSTRLPLPRSGPARVTIPVFPGVTSVSLICAGSCGAGLPPFRSLVPFVRLSR